MIEFKHVNKKYPNGFEALKDIDLTIGQGEFVAIIGLSGAGKSTLIRTINRMHDITNGTLTVDGTDVMQLHGKSLRAFRRRIGMIFQSFNPQIILADEPVASLDPVTAKQVMDDFQRINRDMRITILINIHHVDLALQYATRVIGIRAGRVVYDGPAGEVDGAVLDAIYQDRKEATA